MDLDLYYQCLEIQYGLQRLYDIRITGYWLLSEMELLGESLQTIVDAFLDAGLADPLGAFTDVWSGVRLNRDRRYHGDYRALTRRATGRIDFFNETFEDAQVLPDGSVTHSERGADGIYETIAHELGHVWDRRSGRDLSGGLRGVVGGRYEHSFLWWEWGDYSVSVRAAWTWGGDPFHPENEREDWAYTFAAFVVDVASLEAERAGYVADQLSGLR